MQLILNYSKSLTDFQFLLENLKKRLHISYLKTDIKQQIKTLYHPIYFWDSRTYDSSVIPQIWPSDDT